MAARRLNVGDVFIVPIDDSRSGVGQVVGTYGEDAYYLAIFEAVVTDRDGVDVSTALITRVVFLALSIDAKVAAGHWSIVGNHAVRADMPLPAFKESVGPGGRYDVVSFDGTRWRPATSDEAELLPNRKVVAPVRLEKALRAKHGIGPWIEASTNLGPDEDRTSKRLFG